MLDAECDHALALFAGRGIGIADDAVGGLELHAVEGGYLPRKLWIAFLHQRAAQMLVAGIYQRFIAGEQQRSFAFAGMIGAVGLGFGNAGQILFSACPEAYMEYGETEGFIDVDQRNVVGIGVSAVAVDQDDLAEAVLCDAHADFLEHLHIGGGLQRDGANSHRRS